MEESLLAPVLDKRHLECLDSVSELVDDIVEETQLSLSVRAEGVSLQEAQVLETLLEKEVVEEGASLSHHSFRIVGQFTCGLEQHLVHELAVVEEVIGVWESGEDAERVYSHLSPSTLH